MMDETGANFGFWGTIGAGITALIAGGLAWLNGRQRRQAEDFGYGADAAGYKAEKDIIEKLRAEVARLSDRMQTLESEAYRMRTRVWHLEDELRKNGIPIPPMTPGAAPEAAG